MITMEDRYKCSIIVDLMLTRLNKENGKKEVLVSLRKNTGYNDGQYELPGGHVEKGEDLFKAMIREAKEELNIDLNANKLKIKHILHHYKGERLKFIIATDDYGGDLKIGEPDKCERLEWVSLDDLPSNLDERARKVLIEIKNGVFYDNSDFANL